MRSFVLCLLAAILMWTDALASEADEKVFRYVIACFLRGHPPPALADLMDRRTEVRVTVTFSIDRDGRVLEAKMATGSESAKADQDILDWIMRMQPFPKVPA